MRIEGLPPAVRQLLLDVVAGKGERAAAKDAPMTLPTPPAPSAPAATAMPVPPTSVAMLVTLAAFDPAVERRRKAAAQADRGLGLLESLRDRLAAGLVGPEHLQPLAEWAESLEVPEDAGLAQLAREIELRVRVELAKHDLSA